MFRIVTIAVVLLIFCLGFIYAYQGGLLINMNGNVVRNSELGGSISDASRWIYIGIYSFLISLFLVGFKKGGLGTYFANLIFLYFSLWLTNLDVPIVDSIRYGDYVLFAVILLANCPILYFLATRLFAAVQRLQF